jgi:hypothetical protein
MDGEQYRGEDFKKAHVPIVHEFDCCCKMNDMITFAFSIFLSAFLLFQIQPLIGKVILPWFGGAPAVWSTAMLFFQSLLLGGYAYANWLVKQKKQETIHLSLIVGAILLLVLNSTAWVSPITPSASWKPTGDDQPILEIFKLLVVSVGLPYFVLAANGPLMQAWFSRLYLGVPYTRLYALSNVGSLLGLITYPVWIEPAFALHTQGWVWAVGFALFGALAFRLGVRTLKTDHTQSMAAPNPEAIPPSRPLTLLWLALSATASLFLLSVTNQISQEVAVIPFLWILPLTIYLITFILTFSGGRGYHRRTYIILFSGSLIAAVLVMVNATAVHAAWQIFAYGALLFSACMLCHGELYLLRPPAAQLTSFYLTISLGGALGGVFVSLVAPLIFNGYWELFVALGMTIAIVLTVARQGNTSASRARFVFTVFLLVTLSLAAVSTLFSGALFSKRNFYGVIRVREVLVEGSNEPALVMAHGITVHGLQFINPDLRNSPTAYFVPKSGAGLALLNHPKYGEGMRVGVLGLGAGTLAAYGQPGDEYRLYEINPVVIELAEGEKDYFSFLSESQADIEIVLGDARVSLERELANGQAGNFDVLVLDTFSSDSIPVHLVTKEAMALYLAHLAPDGILAAHITNLHLDLQPVFWNLAREFGLSMARVEYAGDAHGGYVSHWVLLTREPGLLAIPDIQDRAINLSGYFTEIRLWTDSYSNLFQILK